LVYKIVKTTTDSKSTYEKISKEIIAKGFSPCVQIANIDGCESKYLWKGKVETEKEFVLEIKTTSRFLKNVIHVIKKYHNYDIPEIISYDFEILSEKYEKWFHENLE
tara:strand:+ start:307 stop:627 length:321 start_codon:yes stop_codon:yes gene_type:complete